MKKSLMRLFSLTMACAMLFCIAPSANAVAERASQYFARIELEATDMGNGKVVFEFDLIATDTMDELGIKTLNVMEQQSNGSYRSVKTYTSTTNPEFITKDTASAYGRVTYQGTAGTKYYAIMSLYAKDSNGSETRSGSTNIVP